MPLVTDETSVLFLSSKKPLGAGRGLLWLWDTYQQSLWQLKEVSEVIHRLCCRNETRRVAARAGLEPRGPLAPGSQ